MKLNKFAAVLLAIMLLPGVAFGADSSAWTEESGYTDQMVGKLDYGIKNLLGGWTAIIQETKAAKDDENSVVSIFNGFGKGIWNAVAYTLGGAIHTATFLITPVDIPIPDGGVDL